MTPFAGLLGGEGPTLRERRATLVKRLEEARGEEVRAVAAEQAVRDGYAVAVATDPNADPKKFRAEAEKAAAAVAHARFVVSSTEDALAQTDAALAPIEVEERDARLRAILDEGEREAGAAAEELRKLLPKLADLLERGHVADNRISSAVQALAGRLDPKRNVARFAPEEISADYVESFGRKLHPNDRFGGEHPTRPPFANLGWTDLRIPFNAGRTRAACYLDIEPKD